MNVGSRSTTQQEAPIWAPAVTVGGVAAGLMATPSMFPKKASLQKPAVIAAAAIGVGVGLAGEGIARGVDQVLPGDRLAAEGAVAGAGAALAGGITLATRGRVTGGPAVARTAGLLVAAGAAAGAISTLVTRADEQIPGHNLLAVGGTSALIGAAVWGAASHSARSVPASAYVLESLPKYETTMDTFGPLYTERVKWSPVGIASGGPGSALPADKLPPPGKDFLTRRPDTAEIAKVMEADPAGIRETVRAYVALDHAPPGLDEATEVRALAKLGIDELDALGAFGRWETRADGTTVMIEKPRAGILVPGATSTGFVHPVAVNSFEFMYRGDSAILAAQTSRLKAGKEMHHVKRATAQHQAMLELLHERVSQLPDAVRPKVHVYGESYAAWATQDGFAGSKQTPFFAKLAQKKGEWNGPTTYPSYGIERMDQLGVHSALWSGTPHASTLRTAVNADDALAGGVAPEVIQVRNIREADAITPEQAANVRMTFLQHDADPVGEFTPKLVYEDARFLGKHSQRGEGITSRQRQIPIITGIQTLLDQQAAQYHIQGQLVERGHTYGQAPIVAMRRAYHLDVSDEQTRRIGEWNRQLEAFDSVY